MTRVSKACLGLLAGVLVVAVGVGLMVVTVVGLALVAAGAAISSAFLLLYDVDEPKREVGP